MKAVVAENLLLKPQLFVLTRSRKRAPNLSSFDRFFLGLWTTFLNPRRIKRVAFLVQPSTLLKFHQAMVKRKYRLLYSSRNRRRPGPKGPSRELIGLVLEMKRRNSNFGCTKIAEHIAKTFALSLDKDVVRRILTRYYRPNRGTDLHGCHSSVRRKTVCGVSICSGVSPFDSKPIGSSL
jgi:putative transposase